VIRRRVAPQKIARYSSDGIQVGHASSHVAQLPAGKPAISMAMAYQQSPGTMPAAAGLQARWRHASCRKGCTVDMLMMFTRHAAVPRNVCYNASGRRYERDIV